MKTFFVLLLFSNLAVAQNSISSSDTIDFDVTYLNLDIHLGLNETDNGIRYFLGGCDEVNCSYASNTTFTLKYSFQDASNCTATNTSNHLDWQGEIVSSNGEYIKTISNGVSEDTSFALTCYNNILLKDETKVVLVYVEGGADCSSLPPILGGAEDITIIANNSPNPGVYDGTYIGLQNLINPNLADDWPSNFGDSISLSLTRNQYIAASFTTNNLSQRGRFQLATPGNLQGPPSATTISISTCPGDFAEHLSQSSCLKSVGPSGSIKWATDQSATSSYCKLNSNTDYYINIVHSVSAPFYSVSACNSAYCGILAVQVEE
jgi:hypothetical protein